MTDVTRATAPTAWFRPSRMFLTDTGSVPSVLTTKRWEEKEVVAKKKPSVKKKILESDQEPGE